MPVPGLSPMSKARCLQRSSFPSAAGFFLLTQANRSGPCGSCIQFWALAIVEKADKAIAAAIDFIALIFTSLFDLQPDLGQRRITDATIAGRRLSPLLPLILQSHFGEAVWHERTGSQ